MSGPQDIPNMGVAVQGIAFFEASIILWENSHINDIYNNAKISVDGTDIAIPQFKQFWKGWWS